jgi:flagellar protein FliS
MNGMTALKQYQQTSAHGGVMGASPHRLIQMLLDGAIARIFTAKGHIKQNKLDKKCESIGSAISIVDGLRNSLDMEKGGEISSNLDALYDYINRLLLKANISSDISLLDEAGKLLNEIKAGWDAIEPQEK